MAKYIRVASDLHLEQFRDMDTFALEIDHLPKDARDAESVLILAGDISSIPLQLVQFISVVEKRFLKVVYVPGNHEYYRHEMTAWNLGTEALFKENTERTARALGAVGVEVTDGVRYIFGTLWADGGQDEIERLNVQRCLWDFTVITLSGQRFLVKNMIKLHKKQKADIVAALKVPFDGKSIVVTHHMPSYRLCHPRFGADINGGFASNCEDILAYDHAPAIWVHGHTHDTGDRQVFNSRVICNPSGYRSETRGSSYNTYGSKFVEL